MGIQWIRLWISGSGDEMRSEVEPAFRVHFGFTCRPPKMGVFACLPEADGGGPASLAGLSSGEDSQARSTLGRAITGTAAPSVQRTRSRIRGQRLI